MKIYHITRSLLPLSQSRHRYIHDDGRYDYLGQILLQLGYTIPPKTRMPSNLATVIPPFTIKFRGRVRDTPLALEIAKLDYYDTTTHPRRLAELLAPYNIALVWR